jgi:4-hydroxybenzoyl-CoA thioesterase/acyl-CoA thioester hydrolase
MAYELRRTVHLGDDDSSGLIFFATYFRYMSEGEQDYLAALGHPVAAHVRDGVTCPAVGSSCEFVSPVYGGDVLDQTIRLVAGRRSSFRSEHEFRAGERVVARGRIDRVWTELATMTSQPLPDWIRAAAEADGDTP